MTDIIVGVIAYAIFIAAYFALSYIIFNIVKPKNYVSFLAWCLGLKIGAKDASNLRRFFSRCLLFLCWIFLAIAGVEKYSSFFVVDKGSGIISVIIGLAFFLTSVASMPFLQQKDFDVNLKRLLFDTTLSGAFLIGGFSLAYAEYGIIFQGKDTYYDRLNSLYFSAVTFSTLGFGDFSPTPNARPLAAFQAIVGNIHLGIVAGSTFAILNRSRK